MVSCQLHDYIEIACLYGFRIRLLLNDGSSQQGRAITTQTTTDKREWLMIDQPSGPARIELNQIKTMQALDLNSHFDLIEF
jgi:Rho-binding antiterminator